MRIVCALAMVLLMTFSAYAEFNASLLLVNGKIYTVDGKNMIVEAVYIRNGRIAATGKTEKILRSATPGTQVVDLKGRTVFPGFIDSHGHMMSLGMNMLNPDLSKTRSYLDLVSQAANEVAKRKPGEWIIGSGWDQNKWVDKRIPYNTELNARTRDNPVMLTRIDGHACLVNAAALELAGITIDTPDPDGGRIVRAPDGTPTGMLIDRAVNLVASVVPEPDEAQRRRALRLALNHCTSVGLTTVHDAGVDQGTLDLYRDMIDNGTFNFRVYAMLSAGTDAGEAFLSEKPLIGYGQDQLTVRSVKVMADGALGSRGAALFEPYSDEAGNSGLIISDFDTIKRIADRALQQGYQVAAHAIGDRANNIVLRAYEASLKENKTRNHRFRVEHAQILRNSDIDTMAKLNVIASIQATHATSDMYWVIDRIGKERVNRAYSWRTLLSKHVRIANGSDFPVESANPLWGFYAAVTRANHRGQPEGGWRKDQKLTREEALRSFTIDGAYAAFEENIKGSIEVGKWADLVVLSKDIMTVPAQEILQTRVLITLVGGNTVFRHNAKRSN